MSKRVKCRKKITGHIYIPSVVAFKDIKRVFIVTMHFQVSKFTLCQLAIKVEKVHLFAYLLKHSGNVMSQRAVV